MFRGTFTALATPFKNGNYDPVAFRKLIDTQISGGVDGIVPVGTTGESPTLDHEEHRQVIREAVNAADGRCSVIAGTGSNSTAEAIALTKDAEQADVDGALLVAPYYNKPSQAGLYEHFKAIANATSLPLILYSIPGRCGIEIAVDTVVKLAANCPTIRCIKEAGGSVERVSRLRAALPPDFTILSGDDSLTLPFMATGASGVISVASNLVPTAITTLVKHCLEGDYEQARQIHFQHYQLFKDLFIETNPVPVKFALSEIGLLSAEVRLPLHQLAPENATTLKATLASLNLI